MVNNRGNFVWLVNPLKSCRIAKDDRQLCETSMNISLIQFYCFYFRYFFILFFYCENNALWMNRSSFMRILATTFFMVEILSS